MPARPFYDSTPVFAVFVPMAVPSHNRQRRQHWTATHRDDKRVRTAWAAVERRPEVRSALCLWLIFHGTGTATTSSPGLSRSRTRSAPASESTTAKKTASGSMSDKSKHLGQKA